jgi:hypothetical protein
MTILYTSKAVDGEAVDEVVQTIVENYTHETVSVKEGSAATPSITFAAHATDGMYHDGTGPCVSVSGVKRARVSATSLDLTNLPSQTVPSVFAITNPEGYEVSVSASQTCIANPSGDCVAVESARVLVQTPITEFNSGDFTALKINTNDGDGTCIYGVSSSDTVLYGNHGNTAIACNHNGSGTGGPYTIQFREGGSEGDPDSGNNLMVINDTGVVEMTGAQLTVPSVYAIQNPEGYEVSLSATRSCLADASGNCVALTSTGVEIETTITRFESGAGSNFNIDTGNSNGPTFYGESSLDTALYGNYGNTAIACNHNGSVGGGYAIEFREGGTTGDPFTGNNLMVINDDATIEIGRTAVPVSIEFVGQALSSPLDYYHTVSGTVRARNVGNTADFFLSAIDLAYSFTRVGNQVTVSLEGAIDSSSAETEIRFVNLLGVSAPTVAFGGLLITATGAVESIARYVGKPNGDLIIYSDRVIGKFTISSSEGFNSFNFSYSI